MEEKDTFIGLRVVGDKLQAVLRRPYIDIDENGNGKSEMLFDEKALRMRLENLKKHGYPHSETASALIALERHELR